MASDVTELPGLDDLTYPAGPLRALEDRAAKLWQAGQSIISVNGSSAGIIAAILASAHRGSKILLPTNAHRSAIHALVLSGLTPVWYEPLWDSELGVWSTAPVDAFQSALQDGADDFAAALVVTPSFAGAISDVKALSTIAHKHSLPLIVDEAHGAHLPSHAVALGADVTVHSLFKTLSGLTQTSLVHVGEQSLIDAEQVRAMLRLLQTSSPSYILLSSIDAALSQLESNGLKATYEQLSTLRKLFESRLQSMPELTLVSPAPQTDAAHVLVSHKKYSAQKLHDALHESGIAAEAVLGRSVLLLLGVGSTEYDVKAAADALAALPATSHPDAEPVAILTAPKLPQLCMSARQAYLSKSEVIDAHASVGRIAADCYAPCPPGTAVLVPGQRIEAHNVFCFGEKTRIRVVVES